MPIWRAGNISAIDDIKRCRKVFVYGTAGDIKAKMEQKKATADEILVTASGCADT